IKLDNKISFSKKRELLQGLVAQTREDNRQLNSQSALMNRAIQVLAGQGDEGIKAASDARVIMAKEDLSPQEKYEQLSSPFRKVVGKEASRENAVWAADLLNDTKSSPASKTDELKALVDKVCSAKQTENKDAAAQKTETGLSKQAAPYTARLDSANAQLKKLFDPAASVSISDSIPGKNALDAVAARKEELKKGLDAAVAKGDRLGIAKACDAINQFAATVAKIQKFSQTVASTAGVSNTDREEALGHYITAAMNSKQNGGMEAAANQLLTRADEARQKSQGNAGGAAVSYGVDRLYESSNAANNALGGRVADGVLDGVINELKSSHSPGGSFFTTGDLAKLGEMLNPDSPLTNGEQRTKLREALQKFSADAKAAGRADQAQVVDSALAKYEVIDLTAAVKAAGADWETPQAAEVAPVTAAEATKQPSVATQTQIPQPVYEAIKSRGIDPSSVQVHNNANGTTSVFIEMDAFNALSPEDRSWSTMTATIPGTKVNLVYNKDGSNNSIGAAPPGTPMEPLKIIPEAAAPASEEKVVPSAAEQAGQKTAQEKAEARPPTQQETEAALSRLGEVSVPDWARKGAKALQGVSGQPGQAGPVVPQTIPAVLGDSGDKGPEGVIGQMGQPQAGSIQALRAALTDPDAKVSTQAAQALLAALSGPNRLEAMKAIAGALGSGNINEARQAVRILTAAIESPKTREAAFRVLSSSLGSPNGVSRARAMSILTLASSDKGVVGQAARQVIQGAAQSTNPLS
ncbi:MAG: hypothetical protein WCG06_04510, partial [Candidatus Omnitrophota bacterium]